MIHLLDTNVVAELTTRAKPDPRVLAWFRSTARPDRFLSVITVAEIEAGVAVAPDPVRQARYARALDAVRHEYGDRIAPIGEREAAAYLTIHKTLKAAGTSIDPSDALIAATALANGWTVATRNIKHMARTGALVINPWEQRAG
ncbi:MULTISPECIES: type II toxin-antitoxin system VapC family toxin [Streptomyces]|uniref:type II toxin-antitoxin system VapC family toxin n=1 Tax=Streptomyces TaxID=1883 RepID=UPI00129299FD|nr:MULTISPECIES: type II toxin-antitoxin system VapC family toxin [Streptomyces]MCX5037236.1 type II toxin-antitoxin system VapC family toxin [Streptomyces coelicoflavus]QFX83395.1 PIN domain-containing protein [Streptomyces sp. SYP-A7193]